MRIGEIAAGARVNVETLRYYERRGLIQQPSRRPSGYREYEPEAARRVRFIKRAQQLGFTLREIEELLRLRDDKFGRCADVRAAAREKIADVDRKIAALRAVRGALATLEATCARRGEGRRCPLLEALDR